MSIWNILFGNRARRRKPDPPLPEKQQATLDALANEVKHADDDRQVAIVRELAFVKHPQAARMLISMRHRAHPDVTDALRALVLEGLE